MAYDYPTNFSNGTLGVTGVASFLEYMNYVTDSWFGLGLILIIWMMAGVPMIFTFGFAKALAASSFIALIFATYLLSLGMITPSISFAILIALILGVIGSFKENNAGSY